MYCPICGLPYQYKKVNKFGGIEYHHADDPENVFCQQSSASVNAAQQLRAVDVADWSCKKCGSVNFSWREQCRMCDTPRH